MNPRARCVLLSVFILCLLSATFIHVLGIQAFNYYFWKSKHRSSELFRKRMYVLPAVLPQSSTMDFRGNLQSFYGYEFMLPWKRDDQKRQAVYGYVLTFEEGYFSTIFDPSGNANHAEALISLTPDGKRNQLVEIFGPEFVKPNYSALKAILNTTPNDLDLFMNKKNSIKVSSLLTSRYVMIANLPETVIYSFERQGIRGFQQGDPGKDKFIMLRFFDQEDRELTMTVAAGPDTKLTQDQITFIINSFRAVPQTAEPEK